MPPQRTFSGTAKNGNLQKALELAVQAAQQSVTGADRLVTFTVKEISGRQGGIAGFKEVTVAIKARIT
jgi:hypothetical protein